MRNEKSEEDMAIREPMWRDDETNIQRDKSPARDQGQLMADVSLASCLRAGVLEIMRCMFFKFNQSLPGPCCPTYSKGHKTVR